MEKTIYDMSVETGNSANRSTSLNAPMTSDPEKIAKDIWILFIDELRKSGLTEFVDFDGMDSEERQAFIKSVSRSLAAHPSWNARPAMPSDDHNAMEMLQIEIGDWQDATFPNADAFSKFHHLVKEIKELSDALEAPDPSKITGELADCQHLLFGIASKCRVNLYEATRAKFAVNKTRKWGKPDENGVVEHV
jgi:Protein of unknown function (DUF550)